MMEFQMKNTSQNSICRYQQFIHHKTAKPVTLAALKATSVKKYLLFSNNSQNL